MSSFEIKKYLGTWHELAHYPSFFEKNTNYNTTAKYIMRSDGNIDVLNSTYNNSVLITAKGVAKLTDEELEFRVDFDFGDVAKFPRKEGFKPLSMDRSVPNYIIKNVWSRGPNEPYNFAVVTDGTDDALWVLSRDPRPSKEEYAEIIYPRVNQKEYWFQ